MSFAKFGPAGNSESFSLMKYKSTLQIPEYIEKMGLDAYEYQCGRGVNIGLDKAAQFGKLSAEKNIALSLHAPYYISMSSVEEAKRDNSVNYILQSARAVNAMGGTRIVVHTGSCGKISREEALKLAIDTMKKAISALDNEGLSNIRICPETMGKINQLGTLEEVVALCQLDERLLPCIDFGHLNARTLGGLKEKKDFEAIFDMIENKLEYSKEEKAYIYEYFKNKDNLEQQLINEIQTSIESVIEENYVQGNPIRKFNYGINKDEIQETFFHNLKENVVKDIIANSN